MVTNVKGETPEMHATGSHAWQSLEWMEESMVQGPERRATGSHACSVSGGWKNPWCRDPRGALLDHTYLQDLTQQHREFQKHSGF
jgi:hypothetical protein